MRRAALSQRFLSLFTDADRAVSIVGDLTEESRARGKTWCPLQVAGIAFALWLESVRSAPVRCLGLGLSALAMFAGVFALLVVASGLPLYPWHRVNEPEFWIRVLLVVVFANLFTGLILGRWVSFRGTNGIVPLIAVWVAAWLVSSVLRVLIYPQLWPQHLVTALAFPWLYLLPLLVGGTLGRRRPAAGR